MEEIRIRRATAADLERIAPLFDAYRVFYGQRPDMVAAREFMRHRLEAGQSVVYAAELGAIPAGFVQLYPSFDSIDLGCIWILHDLYVDPGHRGKGIGRRLMEAARGLAEESGAAGLSLSTAVDNRVAQALYESLGYRRNTRFHHYFLPVGASSETDAD